MAFIVFVLSCPDLLWVDPECVCGYEMLKFQVECCIYVPEDKREGRLGFLGVSADPQECSRKLVRDFFA